MRVSEKNAQCCCGLWKKSCTFHMSEKNDRQQGESCAYIESASLLLATPKARLYFYARSSHREFKKNKYMNVEKEKHVFFFRARYAKEIMQFKLCGPIDF